MNVRNPIFAFLLILSGSVMAASEYVIEDGGIGITKQELEQLVRLWTPDMQQAAASDHGDRLELLNMALSSKKIEAEALTLTPDADSAAYWRQIFAIRNIRREFAVKSYMAGLTIPDVSKLAEERYHAQKENLALVPESRLSSHILLMCGAPTCFREDRRPEAEKILAELRAGANFEELVPIYSEDPGSKNKGGRFDQWMILGQSGVDPHYTGGVFSIDKIGGYSGIVESKFGFHIIRLDGLKEERYKSYEEVEDQILAMLRTEYLNLSAKEYDARFRISDDAVIDGEAMEEIFGPYETPKYPQ